MTYIGLPMIYYGDEVGMEGATDPHCRKPMLWHRQEQNEELHNWYKELIALRKAHNVLQKAHSAPGSLMRRVMSSALCGGVIRTQ